MTCKACGHNRSRVVDSRSLGARRSGVRRRRQCPKCGVRWSTYEVRIEEGDDLRIYKRPSKPLDVQRIFGLAHELPRERGRIVQHVVMLEPL